MKLQLIIDSDGVLVQTMERIIEKTNKELGTEYTVDDIPDWVLPPEMERYFEEPGFFRDLLPVEGAQKYLKMLYEDGHKIIIATASAKNAILDKINNLTELFPFLRDEDIIPISQKHLLLGDIMLDDGLHNIKVSKCKYPIIMDAPWNRRKWAENYGRVHSWEEFYNFVVEVASIEADKEVV